MNRYKILLGKSKKKPITKKFSKKDKKSFFSNAKNMFDYMTMRGGSWKLVADFYFTDAELIGYRKAGEIVLINADDYKRTKRFLSLAEKGSMGTKVITFRNGAI